MKMKFDKDKCLKLLKERKSLQKEGEFTGQIKKAQPMSDPQLDFLREFNQVD